MGKIANYAIDALPTVKDKVIGTDFNNLDVTKNYTIEDIIKLVPNPTLSTVLAAGNIATNDISLQGVIDTEQLVVGVSATIYGNAAFNNDVLFDFGNVNFQGGVKDDQGNLGTVGMFLSTTGNSVRWVVPPASPGSLQNVLDVGSTAISNLGLTGNLTITGDIGVSGTIITTLLNVTDNAEIQGTSSFLGTSTFNSAIKDGTGKAGTAGQILSSTGTGVEWINNVVVTLPSYNKILTGSSFVKQSPLGLNTPLQLEFGTPQTTVDATLGPLGEVVIQSEGTYLINIFVNIERSGSTGGVASVVYRTLVNGIPNGLTRGTSIENIGTMVGIDISEPYNLIPSDVFTFEIMRDAGGVDQGEAATHSISGGIWTTIPSSSISIWKLI